MNDGPRIYAMGDMLEHIYNDSLEHWRSRYAASSSVADLYGGPVLEARVEVSFLPGGRCTVVCTVEGRRQRETEAYFFRAARKGQDAWIVTDSSLDLD